MKEIRLIYLILLLLVPSIGFAGVYYVDGKDGNDDDLGTSFDQAWKSVRKAADTAQAGDIVYIAGAHDGWNGEYLIDSAGKRLEPANSGTPGNLITFAEYPAYPDPWLVGSLRITGWAKTEGYTNVYQKSVAVSRRYSIYWNDWGMKYVSSISTCDSTAGSYYYDSAAGKTYVNGYGSTKHPDNPSINVRIGNYDHLIHVNKSYITIDGINTAYHGGGGWYMDCARGSAGAHITDVTFKNMEVKCSPDYYQDEGYLVFFQYVDNAVIENNKVYEAGGYHWLDIEISGGDGIHVQNCGASGKTITIVRNEVYNCGHHTICCRSNASNSIIIRNNLLYNSLSAGIDVKQSKGTLIEFNYIHSISNPVGEPGESGIQLYAESHSANDNITIRYNIIDTTTLGGILIGGAWNVDVGGHEIYNNTILNANGGEYANYTAITFEGGIRNFGSFKIYGNILQDNQGGVKLIHVDNSGWTLAASDYNILQDSDGDTYWRYKGGNRNLSTMQSSYNLELNSEQGDISFVDEGNDDYRLGSAEFGRAIDSMSTHPISSWNSNPGSYPSDLIWENVNWGYSELKGKSTKQGSGFDAGACEFVQGGPDIDPPSPPTGLTIH